MVAVLCTNETTPQFFEFLTPPPPPPRGRWIPQGEGARRQTLSVLWRSDFRQTVALLFYVDNVDNVVIIIIS